MNNSEPRPVQSNSYDCRLVKDAASSLLSHGHPAWTAAPECGPFVVMGHPTIPEQKSRVQAVYTPEAVFFQFVCDDPPLAHGKISATDDPARTIRAEPRVELYLDPMREAGEVYYVAHSIYGNTWALRCAAGQGAELQGLPVDCKDIEGRTELTPAGWTIRIKIPFKVLGLGTPGQGSEWRVSPLRVDFATPQPTLHWWPLSTSSSVWEAWGIGRLRFGDPVTTPLSLAPESAQPHHSPTTPAKPPVFFEGTPARSFRGILLPLSLGSLEFQEDYLRELIGALASLRFNVFMLYSDHNVRFRRHESFASTGALDIEAVARLSRHARDLGVCLVPAQPSLGHCNGILSSESYRHLAEDPTFYQLCPSKPETYELLEDLYAQWIDATDSPWFNVNCDESGFLGLCPACAARRNKIGPDGIFVEHLLRLHDFLKRRGKRMMMWGDMLLRMPEAARRLPQDIVILDWHYNADHYPSVNFFLDLGFEVVIAPSCYRTQNLRGFVASCRDLPVMGVLNTLWEAGDSIESFWYDLVHTGLSAWTWQAQAPEQVARAAAWTCFGSQSESLISAIETLGERRVALHQNSRLLGMAVDRVCRELPGCDHGAAGAPDFGNKVREWLFLERDLLAMESGAKAADDEVKRKARQFAESRFAAGWESRSFGKRLARLQLL